MLNKTHLLVSCRHLSVAWAVSLAMSGCGGSSSTSTDPLANGSPVGNGQVYVELTDADGDFLTYTVDVKSIKLTRLDGAEVETAPLASRVDFADYHTLSEFFTAASVPPGRYKDVTVTLDYSAADIEVEKAGQAVDAIAQDPSGNPLSDYVVKAHWNRAEPLVVLPGVPAHLSLDFDLSSSNQVDLSTQPATVTVKPVLLADVAPAVDRPHQIRGTIDPTKVSTTGFVVDVRPFHVGSGRFGNVPVGVNDQTVYEIDGVSYMGSAGLAALQNLQALSLVIAQGSIDVATKRFAASEVYGGSSVPGNQFDVVRGSVLARSGNTLTLRGARLVRRDGTVVYNDTVSVVVGSDTKLTQQGTAQTLYTAEDISVGQRLIAFGSFSSINQLDATNGRVRMLFSEVAGTVTSVATQALTLNLQDVNRRDVRLFDFAGTGQSPEMDADPTQYEISSVLDLSGYLSGEPVRMRGFVTPFGSAPADFVAATVVDLAGVSDAKLGITWTPAAMTPFVAISSTGISIDLSATGTTSGLRRGGVTTPIDGQGQPLQIQPAEAAGIYLISVGSSRHYFADFAAFVAGLQTMLDGSHGATQLLASGHYDPATNAVTTRKLAIELN